MINRIKANPYLRPALPSDTYTAGRTSKRSSASAFGDIRDAKRRKSDTDEMNIGFVGCPSSICRTVTVDVGAQYSIQTTVALPTPDSSSTMHITSSVATSAAVSNNTHHVILIIPTRSAHYFVSHNCIV